MSQEITHIIADVGGVLIKNYDHTREDIQHAVELSDNIFNPIWKNAIGKLSTGGREDDFWCAFQDCGGKAIPADGTLFHDPFEANLQIYSKVLHFLGRSGCHLSILSNTIEPHAEVLSQHGVYDIFTGHVYLSHEIGLLKPSQKAYEYVLERLAEVGNDKILFIDDREENLTIPRIMGMRTLLSSGAEEEIVSSLTSLFSNVKH